MAKKGKYPDTVRSVLSRSFSGLNMGSLIREARVLKSWSECVGPRIARHANAERLIGSTLYCVVSSAPWMSELNYQKRLIIDSINSSLGAEAITEIVFKAGKVSTTVEKASPKRPRKLSAEKRRFIDETVSKVEDPGLRSAIRRALEKAELEE